jgi:hypothetical protein
MVKRQSKKRKRGNAAKICMIASRLDSERLQRCTFYCSSAGEYHDAAQIAKSIFKVSYKLNNQQTKYKECLMRAHGCSSAGIQVGIHKRVTQSPELTTNLYIFGLRFASSPVISEFAILSQAAIPSRCRRCTVRGRRFKCCAVLLGLY